MQNTGEPVITGKKEIFRHYKFGQDSDAKKRLSLSSLVLSDQMPLQWETLKKRPKHLRFVSPDFSFTYTKKKGNCFDIPIAYVKTLISG